MVQVHAVVTLWGFESLPGHQKFRSVD